MGTQHLRDLRNALTRLGWRIVIEHPGDDYAVSGTWEIQRSTKLPSVLIDFSGMSAMGDSCFPMSQAYGCKVRGARGHGLYFGRSRKAWRKNLASFVDAIEQQPEKTT